MKLKLLLKPHAHGQQQVQVLEVAVERRDDVGPVEAVLDAETREQDPVADRGFRVVVGAEAHAVGHTVAAEIVVPVGFGNEIDADGAVATADVHPEAAVPVLLEAEHTRPFRNQSRPTE